MRWEKSTLVALALVALSVVAVGIGTVTADTTEEEPNDEFSTAQEVPEGNVSGEIVSGESDFFRIDLNDTDAIDLELIDREGNINLRLYASNRTEIASDRFRQRDITLKAPADDTYYVEVEGGDQETTGNYTLDVQKITPSENDAFAVNDDFGSAAPVPEGFNDAKVWGGESDFYRIDLNTTDAIDLGFTNRQGNINLRLYAPNRTEIASDRFRQREITLKAPETGTYYVEVEGGDQETTGNYTLDVQKITPSENDAFAVNDDFESAAVLTQQFTDAEVWGGESDFYRVGLNAGDAIGLDFTNRQGNINLRLYAPNRTEVASDTFRNREITYEAGDTGAYFVEVEGGDAQTTGKYTLQSNRTGVPPGVGSLAVSLSPSSIPTNETADVTVTVTDSTSGNPVTGATVSASALGVSAATTDAAGTAELTVNVSATGGYAVSARARGYANASTTLDVGPTNPVVVGNRTAKDPDGDGFLEDVDGDGNANVFDAIALYNNRNAQVVQNNPQFFDFDGDGNINVFDAIALYNQVSA